VVGDKIPVYMSFGHMPRMQIGYLEVPEDLDARRAVRQMFKEMAHFLDSKEYMDHLEQIIREDRDLVTRLEGEK
jgi:hypothetical protein